MKVGLEGDELGGPETSLPGGGYPHPRQQRCRPSLLPKAVDTSPALGKERSKRSQLEPGHQGKSRGTVEKKADLGHNERYEAALGSEK